MPRKQDDLPAMTGPGVEQPKFKDLDRLGDKFIEIRDEKAALATKLGEVEKKIADCMAEHSLLKYQFSDQEIVLKPGKNHIKIKTVKATAADSEPSGDSNGE